MNVYLDALSLRNGRAVFGLEGNITAEEMIEQWEAAMHERAASIGKCAGAEQTTAFLKEHNIPQVSVDTPG